MSWPDELLRTRPAMMLRHRQTRDDPRRAVSVLIQQLGLRLPTSLAEAQAAAHIDAALRRVGMSVSADTFRTLAGNGRGRSSPMLALLGLLAAGVGYTVPLLSLLLDVWGLLVAIGLATLRLQPFFTRRGDSQNVVAIRPAEKLPHWRVVLLARLDTPEERGWLSQLLALRGIGATGRVVAFGLLVALQSLRIATGDPFWWYLQLVPALYLLLLLSVALLPRTQPSRAAGAGAIAALIAAAERAGMLRYVELWAVAIGATASGDGVDNFVARYPFPRGETLFIGLDKLDAGKLTYVTREGTLPVRYADPYLLNLVAEVDAGDPLIDAEPRPARGGPTLLAPLLARGYRTLTLTSYDGGSAEPSAPNRNSDDLLDTLDARLIDQAVRLIVGAIRKLDG